MRSLFGTNTSYLLSWFAFRSLFALCFRARYYNWEQVPARGPVILASNHASFLDPPLIACGLRRPISFLARESLFRFPVIASLLRAWYVVPVDRDGGSASGLRVILGRLLAGGAIILFPEGTRTRDGHMQMARAGIGLIVIKSTAPVVPVRVFGSYEAYGRGRRLPSFRRLAVKYGRPLYFEALRLEAATCSKAWQKEIYQQVSDEIMTSIAALQPHEDKETFP